MKARDLMTSPVLTLPPESTLAEAAALMLANGVSALPVVDEGKMVGILSHSDYTPQRQAYPTANDLFSVLGELVATVNLEEVVKTVRMKQVKDVMKTHVVTIDEHAEAGEVAETMIRQHVHRLPVMSAKKMVGIISRHDLLKLIVQDA